jgi:hypothetical protein
MEALVFFWGKFRRRAKLPTIRAAINRKLTMLGQDPGLQQELLELIPPKFFLAPHASTDNKYRRRDIEAFQDWRSLQKVICITIIKGKRYRTPLMFSIQLLGQILNPGKVRELPDDLEMLGKMLRGNGQRPGVGIRFAHPVVHQQQRPGRQDIPDAAGRFTDRSIDVKV